IWLSAYGADDGGVLLSSIHGIDLGAMAGPPDRPLLAGVAFPGVALSPDRRWIASSGPALWRAADLRLAWPASPPAAVAGDPRPPLDNWVTSSPDGAGVLTSDFTTTAATPWKHGSADDRGQLLYATATRLYDARDGALVRDFGSGLARRPAFSPDGAW